MFFGDMIVTLRTSEVVEIRDRLGWEMVTSKCDSPAIRQYFSCRVLEWFPHPAPNKHCTFTVYLDI